MGKKLDDLLKQVDVRALEQTQRERAAHLEARVATLQRDLESLLRDRGRYAELVSQIKQAIVAHEPFPLVPCTSGDGSSRPMEAVLKISDWQIGEVIRTEETEGFGEFNYAIAQDRVLNQLAPKVIGWVNTHRHAFKIDRLHIFSEADLVSGNIHEELEITNEFPLPVAIVKAAMLFADMIHLFAPHFKEIVIWENDADNHGRYKKKPQAKQKAANNAMYLVHTIANEALSKHKNVRVVRSESMKFIAHVNGWKFLVQHGDTIKGWMGTPYYGLDRDRAREAVKRMGTDKEFDFISCGHFHVPAVISGGILVNGALTGCTEYDHSQGRYAEPAQVSFLVHPTYGFFDWTPWRFHRKRK